MLSANRKGRNVQNTNNNFVQKAIETSGSDSGSGSGTGNGDTGPTGEFSGITNFDIIPFMTNTLTIGNVDLQFNAMYTNELFIGNVPITYYGNSIALPQGSTIGGVNPGTIVILGNLATIENLPTTKVLFLNIAL